MIKQSNAIGKIYYHRGRQAQLPPSINIMEEQEEQTSNEEESIKLEKNSKGYRWTIKIFPIPTSKGEKTRLMQTDIDRLKMLNDDMIKTFENKYEFVKLE